MIIVVEKNILPNGINFSKKDRLEILLPIREVFSNEPAITNAPPQYANSFNIGAQTPTWIALFGLNIRL